jgi:FtsX-like permease family
VSGNDGVQQAVTHAVAAYPNVQVQTRAQFEHTQTASVNQLLGLIYALLGLAVIIALIGIVNTLMLSVFERTREIGLLRAVGMKRRQVRAMIRSEAVILAIFGAIIGIVVGTGMGLALVASLKQQGITDTVVPVSSLIIFLLLSAVLGLVAATWPARRAAKLDVLAAIAAELSRGKTADPPHVAGQRAGPGGVRDQHGASSPHRHRRRRPGPSNPFSLAAERAGALGHDQHAVPRREAAVHPAVHPLGHEERVGRLEEQRADGPVQRPPAQLRKPLGRAGSPAHAAQRHVQGQPQGRVALIEPEPLVVAPAPVSPRRGGADPVLGPIGVLGRPAPAQPPDPPAPAVEHVRHVGPEHDRLHAMTSPHELPHN